jgi:hypothetical protein
MTRNQAIVTVIAIATILVGVLVMIILDFLDVSSEIALAPMFALIGAGVFMLTQMGMNKDLADSDVEGEYLAAGKRSALQISIGIFVTIQSVMLLILLSAFFPGYVYFPVFFTVMIIGVSLIIFGGIMLDSAKKKGNAKNSEPVLPEKHQRIMGAVSGAIMITATGVYLLLGFLKDMWHPGWIVFVIGGLLCGVVSTIVNNLWGGK